MPSGVVSRAREILAELEKLNQKTVEFERPEFASDEEHDSNPLQMSLESGIDDEIIDELKNIDADTLTPLEALTTLYRLAQKAKGKQI